MLFSVSLSLSLHTHPLPLSLPLSAQCRKELESGLKDAPCKMCVIGTRMDEIRTCCTFAYGGRTERQTERNQLKESLTIAKKRVYKR